MKRNLEDLEKLDDLLKKGIISILFSIHLTRKIHKFSATK